MTDRFWNTSRAFWTFVGPALIMVLVGCTMFVANKVKETPTALQVVAPITTATAAADNAGFSNYLQDLNPGDTLLTIYDGTTIEFISVDAITDMGVIRINGIEQPMFLNNRFAAGENAKIILRKYDGEVYKLEIWVK